MSNVVLDTTSSLICDYFDGQTSLRHTVMLSWVIVNDAFNHSMPIMALNIKGINNDDNSLNIHHTIPVTELSVSEYLGNAPRIIRFKSLASKTNTAHCEIYNHTDFNCVLKPILQQNHLGDRPVSYIQQHLMWALGSILALILCIGLSYYYVLPYASRFIAYRIPHTWLSITTEQTLYLMDKTVFKPTQLSKERQDSLTAQFKALKVPHVKQPVLYTLLYRSGKTSNIGANAMAFPDGTIVITDELIALANSNKDITIANQEIMAVLSHELGHLEERHSLRLLIQASAIGAFASYFLGDVSSILVGIPTTLLQLKFSREHEQESDNFAISMLKLNNLSPMLLASILEKLDNSYKNKDNKEDKKDKEKKKDKTELDTLQGYLMTHPDTKARIQAIQSQTSP